MACYHPVLAYQCANGEVVFSELRRYNTVKELSLPCGQCIGCRLERSRQWAMRCLHEASLYSENCFITLTYDEAHLPVRGCLDHSEFQRFLKRLRKEFAPRRIRFYMCGEYGSHTWRPHFHACLFNLDFPDKVIWSSKSRLYSSSTLSRLWPFGFSSIGDLNFETAAYTARYCIQKVTGDLAQLHYARLDQAGPYLLPPEYNHMSLKPGIGAAWADKFLTDVFPHDYVVVNGHKVKPPRFYDRRYDGIDDVKFAREKRARLNYSDNTPARLSVKETVCKARSALLQRNLDAQDLRRA